MSFCSLENGDYSENLRVVFCPNKTIAFFVCLFVCLFVVCCLFLFLPFLCLDDVKPDFQFANLIHYFMPND